MCEKCHNTGYLNGVENQKTGEVLKVSSSLAPGEIERQYRYPTWVHFVQQCACKIDVALYALWEETAKKIPDDVKNQTLEDFRVLEHAADALAFAEAIINGDELTVDGNVKPGLLLVGGTGAGKSSLAYILFKHYSQCGLSCAWLNYNDLVDRIRETYAPDYRGATIAQIVAPYAQVEVLILDDVGSSTREKVMFEDMIEAMRLLYEPRYNKKRVTIGTTNVDTNPDNPSNHMRQQFGAMVFSRMMGNMHVVQMDGVDMRAKV